MTRGVGTRSPPYITRRLEGVDFPASRDELLARARENGAEDEVLRELERIPDEQFEDMADVMAALGGDDQGDDDEEDEDEDDEAGA